MPFEIDLNEIPTEAAATCVTCGRAGGGEGGGDGRCFGCVLGGRRFPEMNALAANAAVGADVAGFSGANMCLGHSDAVPITNVNFLHLGRALSLSRVSRGALQNPHLISDNVESPPKRGIWPPQETDLNSVLRSQSEVYLRALRDYINQRRGFLREGWSVDFFFCQNRSKTSPVYCAPDGSRFGSMVEVARHLGLNVENSNEALALMQRRLHTPQVRKQPLQLSRGNSSRENQNGGSAPFQDLFPLQFEDLIILSSGTIDLRPSYHTIDQIWPVGYRSCWHDNISGSIFVSDVLEGGDAGPVFRVRRFSCSAVPMPVGSIVLSRKNPSPCDGKEKGKDSNNCSSSNEANNDDDDEFLSILMMLNEDTPPDLGEIDFQKTSGSNVESSCEELGDFIGEFSVESRSSLLAWEMASRALLQACHVAYKKMGRLRFFCKHNVGREDFNEENVVDSLSRFCFRSGPIDNIPQMIRNDAEFEASLKLLIKWLQQDRFALDVEFVQEFLEQLPDARACLEYKFLNNRGKIPGSRTIRSGFLSAKRRSETLDGQEPDGLSLTWKRPRRNLEDSNQKSFPFGNPFSKLPPCLIGDLLQGWEFLWRFSEILGLEEPFSLEELEKELIHPWVGNMNLAEGAENGTLNWDIATCTGVALRKAHSLLLKAIVSELVQKVAAILDPFSEAVESKSKKGKKKDTESSSVKKIKFDMLQINALTWPELARRYILFILSLEGDLDSAEITSSIGSSIFHCLQGDGGVLCGSLAGMTGLEADALLLAEARKQIFGLPNNNQVFSLDQLKHAAISSARLVDINDIEVPEWVQVLEPARKLPTNVGARIKKLVHQALELNPPEWAKKKLEHSISREVYKGNASGPTKRVVTSVIDEVTGQSSQLKRKAVKREKSEGVRSFSDLLMKQCRIVLRRTAALDDKKIFCNLLGKTLNPDDEGLMGSAALVSRPLDFRVIDFRLAVGAYAGSQEAFLEDVCEMWNNIRSIYSDQSNRVDLVEKLSQKFKDMYEEEVLLLVQKLPDNFDSFCTTDEAKKEMGEHLMKVIESPLPKAPWEDGICKVCGVDKDDDNVLLCDGCDSEYHTYCLNPPLDRIPDGNWYCPSCVAGRYKSQGTRGAQVARFKKKRGRGEFTEQLMEKLAQLAHSMGSKEYWNFNVEERTLLFKFLCDETLNTSTFRNHLDHCASASIDSQQKLHFLTTEWKSLKNREEVLGSILRKSNITVAESAAEGTTQGDSSDAKLVKEGSLNESNTCSQQPPQSSLNPKCTPEKSATGKRKQKRKGKSTSDQIKGSCQEELLNTLDDQTQVAEDKNGDSGTKPASDSDLISLKDEISSTQEAIASIESELEKLSIRKEFLGRDSSGRIYWGFTRPDFCSILVDRSLEIPNEDYMNMGYPQASCAPISEWVSFQSDSEISEIVEWLSFGETRERELRESVLQWQRSRANEENLFRKGKEPESAKHPASSEFGSTSASAILEKKYGPCLGLDQGHKGKLPLEGATYRCDCLELIWPSKHHCFICHKTYPTSEELEKHYDGNCISQAVEEARKGKKVASEPSTKKHPNERKAGKVSKAKQKVGSSKSKSQDPDCPLDFKEISNKFVTQNSLRELVRGIGLIGSSGNPIFIPGLSPYFDDTALRLAPINEEFKNGNESKDSGDLPFPLREGTSNWNNFPGSLGNNSGDGTSRAPYQTDERVDFQIRRHRGSTGGNIRCVIPGSSLRRLVSRESVILRQLKMNLLDMEAALPEEAVRPSMAQPERRSTWSLFVKSAGSIYEMVQATIVLENMIRADYVRREWWYWSSLTAAANISTLSALALRLSTLEAAIMYEKPAPASDSTSVSESENKENDPTPPKSDKGKEKASPSKPKGKAKKRRKDPGN